MISLSYTISPKLKKTLEDIDKMREKIILTPLSPKNELRFRWEGVLGKIYWSLSLDEGSLTKTEVATLVSFRFKRKLNRDESLVLSYKKALDFIHSQWLVSEEVVTTKNILTIYEKLFGERTVKKEIESFKKAVPTIKFILDYLQSYPEHPVIQAAIAQVAIVDVGPFNTGNGILSRIIGLLFLYKKGYDFRGFIAVEEYWRHNMAIFNGNIQEVIRTGRVNSWIEYFSNSLMFQLEKTISQISTLRFQKDLSAELWLLTIRQQEIINRMEKPGLRINNKEVQRQFGISQITASRDLSKLASLGLLYVHGKGRSVYYTRV